MFVGTKEVKSSDFPPDAQSLAGQEVYNTFFKKSMSEE
jgi:hypothetical protein